MFLNKNEHVILYETREIPYRLEELKSLRNCGVETMLIWAYWHEMEPLKGQYDWSRIEGIIERCNNAGLKLIINGPANAPCGYPQSWYLKNKSGRFLNTSYWFRGFSYWNKNALEYRDHFTKMFCKKFSSETVLCASSFYNEGEYLMHPEAANFYDDAAVDSLKTYFKNLNLSLNEIDIFKATNDWLKKTYIDFALRSQKIYAEHNVKKELWQQLHWMLDVFPHCGTYFLDELYKKTEELTKCEVHQLFCTGYGDPVSENKCQAVNAAWAQVIDYGRSCSQVEKWLDFKNNKGVKNIWLGACWAEGLRKNTPNAIKNDFRGLLCAPLHPFREFARVQPWQFKNFEWAITQWRNKI